MPSLTNRFCGSNSMTSPLDYRLSGLVLCLFLVLFPLSLFAAGHDLSSIRYAPADSFPGRQIAFSGNHFLSLGGGPHIFGSLDNASGRSLAPAFAAVPFASSDVLQLTVAGSGFVAIWNQDTTTPALSTFTSEGVIERRVTLDGEKLHAPRLAFNGTNVLVIDWMTPPTNAIAVSVYDLSGRMVNRFALPVLVSEAYAVTSIGGDFIVVTAGRSGINQWRVANDGTILSTLEIEAPPARPVRSLYDIAVTAKNGQIAIVWSQVQFTTVWSAVIQPDRSVTRYTLATGLGPVSGVAILPVDIGFLVAWNEQRSPTGTRVIAALLNDGGAPLDARPSDLAAGSFSAAASSGNVIELTVLTAPSKQTRLIADVNANAISPRPPVPVAITPVRQLFPVVAGNRAGFTATWLDIVADSQNAVAGRVTATGQALDGTGIPLGVQTSPPAIAEGAFGQLTVWNANGHLVAARLFPSGAMFDSQPIVIAPSTPASYAVTWSGSRYFVVWTDGRELFGAFVETDGTTTPPRPLGIQTPLSAASSLDLAWDGRQFLVVFAETTPGANGVCAIPEGCGDLPPDHVRLMRVSAGGIAIDPIPVRVPGVHNRAHVASSGAESMIALDDDRSSIGKPSDTTAMIVRDDGAGLQLGPEIPLFSWVNSHGSDVAWNGSRYVVAWRYTFGPQGWIGAKTISQSGLPLASLFTPTAGLPEGALPYSAPSVATNDAGDAAIVISEVAPPSYTARARHYLMSELAPMPLPPAAPRNVVAYVTGTTTHVTWQSDGTQVGFQIEVSADFGKNWTQRAFTGDARIATLVSDPRFTLFRVSAFGPGGFSEPVIASIGKLERRSAPRR